jgi:uncharacterized Rmd1/YagE family protein
MPATEIRAPVSTRSDLEKSLLITQSGFMARALLLGERLQMRGGEREFVLADTPPGIGLRSQGAALLIRFGVVVLFDVNPDDEAAFLASIKSRVIHPYETSESEEIQMTVAPDQAEGIHAGVVSIRELSLDRLEMVADVLAKSVALARYETGVAATFDRIEPLAQDLEHAGRIRGQERELLKHIGSTLRIEHMMVGRAAVQDKPELLWTSPELEGFFLRLREEFEIQDRYLALEGQLGVITRTAETLLELIQNRHTRRIEIYIVALIAFEIVLTLYQMLFSGGAH